jgi:hypothetical protein
MFSVVLTEVTASFPFFAMSMFVLRVQGADGEHRQQQCNHQDENDAFFIPSSLAIHILAIRITSS